MAPHHVATISNAVCRPWSIQLSDGDGIALAQRFQRLGRSARMVLISSSKTFAQPAWVNAPI
jgi:hypothetical protein